MRFRPCIDIHNGKVKQIVGSSLSDENDYARENFVAEQDAAWFAGLYRKDGLKGGHVILLNKEGSAFYEETKAEACRALAAYPGGLQIGGGINPGNAAGYLKAGASQVIVTSYVFRDGQMDEAALGRMVSAVGREHLVLDLSCRRKDGRYYIATDRWQKLTDVEVTPALMTRLSSSCSEFLIHAVDVEGKASGIEEDLAAMLGGWEGIPVTYAGGVGSMADVERLEVLGKGRLDVTIGSALDLFGGCIRYRDVVYLGHQKKPFSTGG